MLRQMFGLLTCGLLLAQLATGLVSLEDISEGACVKVKPLTMEQLDFDWALHFTVEAGYVPMASKLHYYLSTMMLTQEPLNSWEQINSMCPKVESGLFDSTLTGYGKRVEMSCEIQAVGVVDCFEKNDPNRANSSIIISWSDNAKYMVSVSCLPGGLKSWNVISTQKSVDQESRAKILRHLKQYGFNPDKAAFPSYATCP